MVSLFKALICFSAMIIGSSYLLNQGIRSLILARLQRKSFNNQLTKRYLNRLLFESHEVHPLQKNDQDTIFIGELNENDSRYKHIVKILKLQDKDTIKTGIINEGMTDFGQIHYNNPFPEKIQQGRKKLWVQIGNKSDLKQVKKPQIDLILALPRPQRLERLISIISCLGVHRLVLVRANKVENDYFGSHLLRPERRSELNSLFIDGLAQAAVDYHLPEFHLCRYFNGSVVERIFGDDARNSLKLFAHPLKGDGEVASSLFQTFQQLQSNQKDQTSKDRIMVAIGPEGGWESSEILSYEKLGFHCFHVGERILRSDIAVNVILGSLHQLLDERSTKEMNNRTNPEE